MIRSFLKIAWRNIIKDKGYTFINVTGLAIGMAAAILILLWIKNELTFDRFYTNTDRIYQVYSRDTFDGKPWAWGQTGGPLAPALQKDYPEIEGVTRFTDMSYLLTVGEKRLKTKGAIVDSAFIDIFGLELTNGISENALNQQDGIVISERLAKKLFADTDPVGKMVRLDTLESRVVTAVIKDIPEYSRFKDLDFLMRFKSSELLEWGSSWTANNFRTYVLLKTGTDYNSINSKIKNIITDHTKGTGDLTNAEVFLHPASKWHLFSKSENGELIGGKITTVRLFGLIAILILFIACINFMNLSTARSEKRAKEVGVRKVIGAQKHTLIVQFLAESLLMSVLAGVLALFLVWISLPIFNQLVGYNLFINIASPILCLSLLAFIIFTGLLAGSYPAFFLSSFQPIKVLKGTLHSVSGAFKPRKILVVIQFTVAIVLIISTLIIARQIDYAQNRDTGFSKDQLVFSSLEGNLQKNYELVKHDLINSGAVVSVTKSLSPITQRKSDAWGFSWPESTDKDLQVDFLILSTDADFQSTMGVKILKGRDIDVYKYPTDSTAVLLNEQAVKTMNLKDPVGTIIKRTGEEWHVVGVVNDFIHESPYESIEPAIIQGPASWFNYINYRLSSNKSTEESLQLIEQIFKKYNPVYSFEYTFADDDYYRKFKEEQRSRRLFTIFSGLTIFISCLGLLGLVSYAAEQRSKEIGVRKVLGASVNSIIRLMSSDFIKLVFIAIVIATPIAWWTMNKWLEDFTYRIGVQWWLFVLSGLMAMAIALLTVCFQAVQAARTNPVDSLRDE